MPTEFSCRFACGFALLSMACEASSGARQEQAESAPSHTPSPPPSPSSAVAVQSSPPDANRFARRTAEATQIEPYFVEGHSVQVNLHPYCQPEKQRSEGVNNDLLWLGRGTDYYSKLHETLASEPGYVGIVTEAERKRLVVVLEPEFQAWGSLQSRIKQPSPVPVELRPACHSKEQRERALEIIRELDQDAATGEALHAWAPDSSIGGYRIYLLPGSTKEAAHVTERLGSIANVWYSRPFGLH